MLLGLFTRNSSISFATLAGAYIGESLERPLTFQFSILPFCYLQKQGSFAKAGIKLKCFSFRGFNCITKSQKPLSQDLKQAGLKNNNKSFLNCNRITTWDDQSLGFYLLVL
jgi:hypothetical protein